MSKVFVLTEGVYSEYHIVAVCSSRAKAEEAVERLAWSGGKAIEIEEYELDDILEKEKGWEIRMDKDGDAYSMYRVFIDRARPKYHLFSNGEDTLLENNVLTEDEQTAVKATNELRVRLIAQDLWYYEGEKVSCSACGGAGLEGENLCPVCQGHGKVLRSEAIV